MHDSHRVSVWTALVAVLVFALFAFGGGMLYADHQHAAAAAVSGAPQGVDLSPVWKAWDIINENFVPAAVASTSPLASTTAEQNQNKVWGLITGLADSLNDPYTFFLPPTENQQFSDDMSGQFEGVGMEIDIKDGILTVVTPLKGTPAEAAGIKTDDQILKIDGVDTKGLDVDAAIKKIRGPKGTQVALMVLRQGWSEPREIKVTRDVINVPIITTTKRSDGVFVITFSEFTANAPQLFRNALREFVESGDQKLVLDMRGNPGGYLDAAVDTASWFLPAGSVVVTEDYAGHAQNIVHRSSGYNIFNDNLKMVILVDQGTASASEILSDALRYYGKAKLVGTQTYGKGVVQELFPITNTTSLKVTVARWLGPDGKQIPITGITPDVVATTTEAAIKAGKDPQMEKAVEIIDQM
ncbi:MAG TPA: S41 family peptidase [Candidatus Paceibacterota bacterium]|nr:S41 family peptidase [Candidatus Paceibacterota bacterium]